MLAALRVLHLDSSHAQAVLAAIEEHPTLMTYQLRWWACTLTVTGRRTTL
jgi:hypothetical protein